MAPTRCLPTSNQMDVESVRRMERVPLRRDRFP